jgi:hypothetical protein
VMQEQARQKQAFLQTRTMVNTEKSRINMIRVRLCSLPSNQLPWQPRVRFATTDWACRVFLRFTHAVCGEVEAQHGCDSAAPRSVVHSLTITTINQMSQPVVHSLTVATMNRMS